MCYEMKLQPSDVSWMKSLKQAYKARWNEWMINASKTLTASNNIRFPGYASVLTLISQI